MAVHSAHKGATVADDSYAGCNFIGGANSDVIALWVRKDRTSVCLGEGPVDFTETIAAKAEAEGGDSETQPFPLPVRW